ncbi:MAG TPA: DUF2614 family zinc ribbon-containing protein [Candidatus Paceibacterota bacterium]|nr:DUF2614 family zinc ribbon-containing protein [Candidatus Paceibacterota bacterium]
MNPNKHPVATKVGRILEIVMSVVLAGALFSFACLWIRSGNSILGGNLLFTLAYAGLFGICLVLAATSSDKWLSAPATVAGIKVKCPRCGQLTPMTERTLFNELCEQRIKCDCGYRATRPAERNPDGTLKWDPWN